MDQSIGNKQLMRRDNTELTERGSAGVDKPSGPGTFFVNVK